MNLDGHAEDALGFLHSAEKLQRRGFRWRARSLDLTLCLAELASVFLVGLLAAGIVPSSLGAIPPHPAMFAAGAATLAAIAIGRPRRAASNAMVLIGLQVTSACIAGMAILLFSSVPWRADLAWGAGELIGTAALLTSLHAIYAEGVGMLDADGRLATHVAILGAGPVARRLQAELAADDSLSLKVVGLYTQDDAEPSHRTIARGSLRTLLADCRLGFVDAIVLAPEPGDPEAPERLRRSLRACIQDIHLAPELSTPLSGGAQPKLGPLLSRRPIRGAPAAAKRAFDIAGALVLVAFMAPLLALLALAIALDSPGPVLFRQLRVGYNNQLFYILKFRSMHHEAADRLAKQQTVDGDTRITRVGRVIRRLSLDELPQLFNVLRGGMSLVGPRPHAPGTSIGGKRVHTVVEDYACRHLVRPGITGLAQVRGLRGGLHNRRQVAARVAADLEYIERWSIWLDVRILLGTVVLELRNNRGS
jgi:exopolysaccharide biosynthesis polyprenyl glycosylphosphotransferase